MSILKTPFVSITPFTFLVACLFAFLPGPIVLAADTVPLQDKVVCMERPLAEFGRYIGNWDIADSSLSAEIGAWKPGAAR